ncbi:MAG: TetR/AcrR family transcriptional regulator [Erysipelotrichaceae bacterium]|nr:TetR/AcrR family transcriptional regulator [Erysipelotrichaceae bacterium]
MDRRQKKTRQAVFDAFTHLLEEKTYSNITVQDIIDEADIGRSTFYSHFETKDELLKALCTEIFEHVFAEKLTKENTHDFSSRRNDLAAELTHILYHLKDSSRYISRILSCESGEMFMQYFKEYLARIFAGELEKKKTDIPKDYLLNHMVCDFAETVRWWMNHPEYSPEDISGFFLSTTPF